MTSFIVHGSTNTTTVPVHLHAIDFNLISIDFIFMDILICPNFVTIFTVLRFLVSFAFFSFPKFPTIHAECFWFVLRLVRRLTTDNTRRYYTLGKWLKELRLSWKISPATQCSQGFLFLLLFYCRPIDNAMAILLPNLQLHIQIWISYKKIAHNFHLVQIFLLSFFNIILVVGLASRRI